LVKNACPETTIIVGGQHASLLPEDLFDSSVDLVCIGPGEQTFREVAEAVYHKTRFDTIDGLAVRKGVDYILTRPRTYDSGYIEWPAFNRNLVSKKYSRNYLQVFERRKAVYTITTSGCPHRCNFCALWAAARGTYRRRKPEDIVEDIASQPQPYVHLTDDNTFHNENHAMEIYERLKRRGIKKKILAYARSDTIINKVELFKKWREVGLGALVVGMEAVADDHLETINKKSSVKLNIEAHQIMEELRIENWAHFVIMPEFQKEDFQAVWDFVEDLNITYPVFAAMTPVPGTPLFFEEKEKGRITTFDYGFYTFQYMILKTDLPKEEWNKHFWDLYKKSCSAKTLMRRRKSPSFNLRPALGRAYVMSQTARLIQSHLKEQLRLEKTVRYEDYEHLMLPSMRKDYKPDKYYNATKLSVLKKSVEDNRLLEAVGK
jgi:radical SAM superfamily enzyme YgiQ (UPF0313 family)